MVRSRYRSLGVSISIFIVGIAVIIVLISVAFVVPAVTTDLGWVCGGIDGRLVSFAASRAAAGDDAAQAMAEAAVKQKKEIAKLKRELKKKPKEVIKEVEKVVEVEKDDVDINLRAPKGIKALEKKLEKRLNKDGD